MNSRMMFRLSLVAAVVSAGVIGARYLWLSLAVTRGMTALAMYDGDERARLAERIITLNDAKQFTGWFAILTPLAILALFYALRWALRTPQYSPTEAR